MTKYNKNYNSKQKNRDYDTNETNNVIKNSNKYYIWMEITKKYL